MNKQISQFIETLDNAPLTLQFAGVIELIDQHYDFQVTGFTNGEQRNEAGENSGSCKVLSFAKMNDLTQQQTLSLFAQFYQDVVNAPNGHDHQNIRQFIQHGFARLSFDTPALTLKS